MLRKAKKCLNWQLFVIVVLTITVSKLEGQVKKPNIIFIMSDDHAVKAISAYSNKLIKTPNIDRLAKEGMIFNRGYVTNSLCAPSRAAMLTGKYSSKNGLRDNRDEFDGSQQTFPKLLRKAGYQTSIIGKWHLKTEPTGFDNYKILLGQGEYYNPRFLENGDTNRYIGYTTDLITNFALKELEKASSRKQPFALLVYHKAPHRNWLPNPKYFGAFDSVNIPLPLTFDDEYHTRKPAAHADMRVDGMYLSYDLKLNKGSYKKETGTGGLKWFAERAEQFWENNLKRFTPQQRQAWDAYYDKVNADFKNANLSGNDLLRWKYKRYMTDYLSCILSVDESVGKILDFLDAHNLSQNTIVVYTSDQGFYLGEHGWYDKRWMYEESFRTPILIRYPEKIKPNSVSDDFVMNIDFAPTFLDYTGIPVPKDIQGESIRNILEGKPHPNWRKSMFYHYYEYPHGWHLVKQHYGIRTERYKLIYFYKDDYWELFDLKNDPHELSNIYCAMENTELVKNLKEELKKLRAKYGDTDD